MSMANSFDAIFPNSKTMTTFYLMLSIAPIITKTKASKIALQGFPASLNTGVTHLHNHPAASSTTPTLSPP
jgi:hypothetical protein